MVIPIQNAGSVQFRLSKFSWMLIEMHYFTNPNKFTNSLIGKRFYLSCCTILFSLFTCV